MGNAVTATTPVYARQVQAGGDMTKAVYDPAGIEEQLVGMSGTIVQTQVQVGDSGIVTPSASNANLALAPDGTGQIEAKAAITTSANTDLALAPNGTGNVNISNGQLTGSHGIGGTTNLLLGTNAGQNLTSGRTGHTLIGVQAGATQSSSFNTTCIGHQADCTLFNQGGLVCVGYKAKAAQNSVALGADTTAANSASIVIGAGAASTDSNQFVVGSASYSINNVYFGAGAATPSATVHCGTLTLTNVPTSDPAVAGAIWNDAGTLKISAG